MVTRTIGEIDLLKRNIGIQNGGFQSIEDVLKLFQLEYSQCYPFYKVGNTVANQGWILHVSLILPQIISGLMKILPIILQEGIAFKVPVDLDAAQNILNSAYGIDMVGKVIKIYPETTDIAVRIAKILIEQLKEFRGPTVYTDCLLGGVLYTRYGSYKWAQEYDAAGSPVKILIDHGGNIIHDVKPIPFKFPFDLAWPFEQIIQPNVSYSESIILNKKYLHTSLLKSDAKGNVLKGVKIFPLYKMSQVLIKQGKCNMLVNEIGEGIHERLKWQFELHKTLQGAVALPEVYDLFQIAGDTYLVMQFIDGYSLQKYLNLVFQNRSWSLIPIKEKVKVIDFIIAYLSEVLKLHNLGYVHRDISPENGIIDCNGKIWLVDTELVYSYKNKVPVVPFYYGTPGFISPEQLLKIEPEVSHDIYSIGALLIYSLTGMSPFHFNLSNQNLLYKQVIHFICDVKIANLLCSCVAQKNCDRPNLSFVLEELSSYKERIKGGEFNCISTNYKIKDIEEVIQLGINALHDEIFTSPDNVWFTKFRRTTELLVQNELSMNTIYPGLYDGISGILLFLAISNYQRYDISSLKDILESSLEYQYNNFVLNSKSSSNGLLFGKIGIGFSLQLAINLSLFKIDDIHPDWIFKLLNVPVDKLDIANGLSGKGLAFLRLAKKFNGDDLRMVLDDIVTYILSHQMKDGSWLLDGEYNDSLKMKYSGLLYGNSGIIYFLLCYLERYPNERVEKAVIKSLRWLKRSNKIIPGGVQTYPGSKEFNFGLSTGLIGILLTYVKAYSVFKFPEYRIFVESTLYSYPSQFLYRDLSLSDGLTGMGDLLIEAYTQFNNPEWKERAYYIRSVLLSTYRLKDDQILYWNYRKTEEPVPGFFNGQSGILYFLLRSIHTDISHPIL
jgi:serine/threonine protein kinase